MSKVPTVEGGPIKSIISLLFVIFTIYSNNEVEEKDLYKKTKGPMQEDGSP